MKDLEDYYYQKGEYNYDNYNEYNSDEDVSDNDMPKAYLETLTYKEQQKYLEGVVDSSVEFAYKKLFPKKKLFPNKK